MDTIMLVVAFVVLTGGAWAFVSMIRKSDAESAEIIRKGKESGEI